MSRQNRRQNCTGGAKTDSNQVDEPSNCIICLEKVSTRGKLSVCNHWFCFPCILEWSQNTNTCPICKARFRCITKVHLSPLKSPPRKVRVGDRDQRVWNDDDDLAPEDVLAFVDDDDFDDDYEPPTNVANSSTLGRHRRHQYQRGGAARTSRQATVDEYDMEDSFIDDSDETQLQAYFHDTTYSGEASVVVDDYDDNDDDEDDNDEDDDDSVLSVDSSTSSQVQLMGNSPYRLRSTTKPWTRTMNSGMNNSTRLLQSSDQSCHSPASSGSFIVSDDDSCDELHNDWVPPAKQNNARNKASQQMTAKNKTSCTTKNTCKSRPRNGSSARLRPRRQQGKRSRSSQGNSNARVTRGRLVDGGTRSSPNEQQLCTVSGWINGAERRTQLPVSASAFKRESTVASNEDDSKCEENCSDNSDSEFAELSSRIRGKRLKVDATNPRRRERSANVLFFPRKTTESKQTRGGNYGPRVTQQQQQQNLSTASTLTVDPVHGVAGNPSRVDDVDFASASFILPTPQSKRKRSILTRRKHRSPGSTFEDPEDKRASKKKCNHVPSSHGGKVTENCRRTETILSNERDTYTQISLVKKQKAPRKRILSISSDSD